MLKMRLIPCLDVKDGRVVKGVNFVDLIDAGDPVASARAYDAAGADELCFLDIKATHENRGTMYDLATRTAEHCFMPLTIGGGVRSVDDVRNLLLAGADKVSFNSAAVADPDVIARAADKFGSQCIVVAIDAKTVEDLDNDTRTQWRSWLRGMDQSINREKWHNLVTASWCFVLRHPGYPEAQHVSKEDRERQGATWASGGGDDDGRAFTACCDMHGDVFEAAYPRWCATGRLPAGLKGCVVETGLTNCDAQELRRCWSCCPDASVVVGTLVDLLEITGCEKC